MALQIAADKHKLQVAQMQRKVQPCALVQSPVHTDTGQRPDRLMTLVQLQSLEVE
jgi:hypothetical protein